MITRKAALIQMYGRTLNVIELIEETRNRVYETLQEVPYSDEVGAVISAIDMLARDANAELANAIIDLQRVIPDAEVHPLTGDVLDKSERL